ncbi:hypothetical protein H310_05017 [Aphanomyces invadans]|uniref:UDENN domain-containing protein n=1 Tax=Aphanomyces invadans TaxID=157072 RepID=A0A024UDA5_9STRA|nr:hypothetical protein H310_05017 [Aphanomyces invadans]ETW03613.1 hypothetical protein H310_05017 [Aphanomyces invadans]|eukprot:XP_008867842.1 hypothetical protein H310_05017 [Aphanomyces invadans]
MSITVSNYWGVIAIASVVFDIDVGQSLDMVYPEAVALSAEVKQSIAYLALPHSNKLVEGDTQFSFRVRRQDASLNADSCTSTDSDATSLSPSFYYGFVLFRQRKDATQSRGYFQKSMVVLTEVPFVGLYDRVLRIVGPLFFQVGNPLLQALYENFGQWPAPVANSTMALQVAGTVVTFVVPKTISYQDATLYTRRWSIDDESFDVELGDVVDEATDDDRVGATTDKTIIQNGKFCIVHSTDVSASEAVPPPLCFADWLNLNELGMSFESVGLYSSFEGVETCLWDLWQLAITGDSVLMASPNARVCSQAVLAFTSLIAPVPFRGDFRPYFTLYEPDFNVLAKASESNLALPTTILGTTNPFFLKALKRWPNALLFPFADAPPQPSTHQVDDSSSGGAPVTVYKCIKRNVDLDVYSDVESPKLLTRTTRLVVPDNTILRQLVEPNSTEQEAAAPGEEQPYVSINNALLRKHFKHVTELFLKPFEVYFGIWSNHLGVHPTPYMDIASFMKPFHAKEFLAALGKRSLKLPFALRTTKAKVKMLYARFIASPHFQPWFNYRRNECIEAFDGMLHTLRGTISSQDLMREPSGIGMALPALYTLAAQIDKMIAVESAKVPVDAAHLEILHRHLRDVQDAIANGNH